MQDDAYPEHRSGDEHTRHIVRLTLHELLDSVGVDLATSHGRQRFRDNITFVDDARSGTAAVKKTILGLLVTGFCYGVWKVIVIFSAAATR